MSFDWSALQSITDYRKQKGEDWTLHLQRPKEPPMLYEHLSRQAYEKVVLRNEESLNDLLSTFNAVLEAADIDARYTQINEDYAAWQASNEQEKERAREFPAELTTCLSSGDVSNLIRRYKKGEGHGSTPADPASDPGLSDS